jgi:hypothetical protein
MSFTSTLSTPFTPAQLNRSNGIKFALSNIDGVPVTTKNILEINPFGDLNNNGVDDFTVRLTRLSAIPNSSTPTYVIYGSTSQPPFPLDLNNLPVSFDSGGRGELLSPGISGNGFVSQIADINGDRLKDFSVTTFLGNNDYVLFNKVRVGLKPSEIFIDDPKTIDSTKGFRLSDGTPENRTSRFMVLGDLNGDGIKDFKFDSNNGTTVIFGRRDGFPSQIDPNFVNGINGFRIIGNSSDEGTSNAGDVNGDRRDDLIVKGQNGKNYLISSTATFPAEIDLNNFPTELGTEIASYTFSKTDPYAEVFPSKLLPIGDVNGDGLADLYASVQGVAFYSDHIIYGSRDPLPDRFAFLFGDSKTAGTTRLPNDGLTQITGMGKLGDINNDNIDDFILYRYSFSDRFVRGGPSSYVFFGRAGGLGDTIGNYSQGFSVDGEASNIGDFNGDGINDIYAGNKIIFGGRLIKSLTDAEVDGKNGIIVGKDLRPIGDINIDGRVDMAGSDFVIYGTSRILNNNEIYQFRNTAGGRAYNHNQFPDSNMTNAVRLNYSSTAAVPTWIYGGTGNDTLAGHSGYMDQLTGGDGADTFVFNLEFGQQKEKGFGVVWDFVPGVDKVQVYGTANDYFFVEDNNVWLNNPSFLQKTIDTSATVNTILARRDADLGAVMIGAFSDVKLSISDLSFVPNTSV